MGSRWQQRWQTGLKAVASATSWWLGGTDLGFATPTGLDWCDDDGYGANGGDGVVGVAGLSAWQRGAGSRGLGKSGSKRC
ncbi:hypothetical protein M0R45_025910 [Rubus argutus]|uniref:Secreted protein n=1 Tax=Rubus argutus TaxID=59490 RepID=A0AAW1WVE8_RUBAR